MARSTGVVRNLDNLGRVVVPVELRRSLGIDERDPLEFLIEGNHIILRKYETSCTFCNNQEDLERFKGRMVCQSCQDEMAS